MTKQISATHEGIAREAALAYAESATVGALIETVDEGDSTVSYIFDSTLKGYLGWRWSVTLFEGDPKNPTLSEVMLLPGVDSLVAPAWVPWSERLADWKALQAELEAQAAAEAAEAAELEGDEDSEDDAEDEADDEAEDNWVEPDENFDKADELHNLEHEEAHVLEVVESTSDDSEEEADELAATDLEPGEDAKPEAEEASDRPPRFARRNRRWGKKKDR